MTGDGQPGPGNPLEGLDDGEPLNVSDAADIWLSSGMDEDQMFGYTESELRRAAGMEGTP